MGNVRAFIIDFLPLAVIFLESELDKVHKGKAKKSFDRKANKEDLDFDDFQSAYITSEKQLGKRLPLLFGLVTFVIAISYVAYYQEYGRELAIFGVHWGTVKVGQGFRAVIYGIYLTIGALATYTFGRLSSAFEVQKLPQDVVDLLPKRPKVRAKKEKPVKEPKPVPVIDKKGPCPLCGYPLKVGPDGTTKRAFAGHSRRCRGLKKQVEEGDF